MNLCINCKHGRPMAGPEAPFAAELVHCIHPENHRLVTSCVTGALVDSFTGSLWCRDERSFGAACGPEGVRFQPKEST